MKNTKKLIAPIIITVLLVVFFAFYLVMVFFVPVNILVKLVICLIPGGFIGVCIYNLIQRIKEINSGFEDDLDKY